MPSSLSSFEGEQQNFVPQQFIPVNPLLIFAVGRTPSDQKSGHQAGEKHDVIVYIKFMTESLRLYAVFYDPGQDLSIEPVFLINVG